MAKIGGNVMSIIDHVNDFSKYHKLVNAIEKTMGLARYNVGGEYYSRLTNGRGNNSIPAPFLGPEVV